jgi:exopolysaccharide biosynthesis polyprenyl glycosylphosphotransferase
MGSPAKETTSRAEPRFASVREFTAATTPHRYQPRSGFPLAYIFADLALTCVVSTVVFQVWADRLADSRVAAHKQIFGPLPGFLIAYAVLIALCLHGQGLYQKQLRPMYDQSLAVCRAMAVSTVLLSFFVYVSGVKNVSRLLLGIDAIAVTITLLIWRIARDSIVRRQLAQGHGVRNVLIVGAGKVGRALARYFDEHADLGYRVKGFLDNRQLDNDARLLGTLGELRRVARSQFIDEVVITIPSEREAVKAVALEARRNRLDVKVVPELYDGLGWQAAVEHVGDFMVLALHQEPISPLGMLVKRAVDIFASALALVLLSPFLLLVVILIKLDSPGPVLYRSLRVGRKGDNFVCYKFRSMVAGAEAQRANVQHLNQRDSVLFKSDNDPRVTRIGRLLRKYSIDEFPQFWNVLCGTMSLVGPRPPIVGEYQLYSMDHLRRLDVTPGITGLWQVRARRDPSFDKYINLDLEYIENWSVWLDLKILLQTIPVVCKGTGQ